MKVLSLFDGISCGRVALERAGYNVETYYASEIDKYAIQVSADNYDDIIRLGDITKWREWNIDWKSIDLVLAGSPCQGFSFAGKQLAFDDPRSSLFFEFVNIYNHIKALNPNVKFLLENVKMKQEFKDIISSLLGVQPIMINSALLSAQNRQRLYWANWEFGQPEDLGIVLSDVLQDDFEVDDKYIINTNLTINNSGNLLVKEATKKGFVEVEPGECVDLTFPTSKTRRWRSMKDKSNCLTAANFDYVKYNGCAQRGRYNTEGKTEQQIEVRQDEKANCLSLAQKDSMIAEFKNCVRKNVVEQYDDIIKSEKDIHQLKCESGFQDNKVGCKKSPTLRAGNSFTLGRTKDFIIRRLTPVECERLQTLPDDYTKYGIDENDKQVTISNTQRYKALGNGWTVEVITHILKRMKG